MQLGSTSTLGIWCKCALIGPCCEAFRDRVVWRQVSYREGTLGLTGKGEWVRRAPWSCGPSVGAGESAGSSVVGAVVHSGPIDQDGGRCLCGSNDSRECIWGACALCPGVGSLSSAACPKFPLVHTLGGSRDGSVLWSLSPS